MPNSNKESEINFQSLSVMEMFSTLARFKTLVIIITLVVTLTTFIFANLKGPSFKSSAMIEIGHFKIDNKLIPLHTKEDFKINLESHFIHKLKFKNLIIKPIAGRLFKIEISSSSSENSINNLNQVIEFIISGDKDKFNTEAATLKFRINDLENEIKKLEAQNKKSIDILTKEIEFIDTQINLETKPSLYDARVTLLLSIENLKTSPLILDLKSKKTSLESQLRYRGFDKINTKVVGEITSETVEFRKNFLVFLSFIIAFFGSIFIVLFFEYLKNTKRLQI